MFLTARDDALRVPCKSHKMPAARPRRYRDRVRRGRPCPRRSPSRASGRQMIARFRLVAQARELMLLALQLGPVVAQRTPPLSLIEPGGDPAGDEAEEYAGEEQHPERHVERRPGEVIVYR